MRYLEVRRHSKRERPQQHLSAWGVALARRVGEGLGPFDLVVTSPLARCVETAVAMGFAVTETLEPLAGADGLGETFPHITEVDWATGGAGMATLIATRPALAEFVAHQAEIWRGVVARLPEEGRALLIGHGGAYLDGVAVYGLPQASHESWGNFSSYCEGFRLNYTTNHITTIELLRIQP